MVRLKILACSEVGMGGKRINMVDNNMNHTYGYEANDGEGQFRRTITERIISFLHSGEKETIFEPMEREQREVIHSVAHDHSLKTHCIGFGQKQEVVVRHIIRASFKSDNRARESRPLILGPYEKQCLISFLRHYPVTEKVVDAYQRAGYVGRRIREQRIFVNREKLIPPLACERPSMKEFRRRLPTFRKRAEILEAIREHKVTIIIGGTGCGKTTQVPQFILEEAAENRVPVRIYCTQPRRLPAVAVANRVAKERDEKVGYTVGYHIRLEQRTSDFTTLTYCTSGVLLRLLTNDNIAHNISHIILDEIHERELKTDYLLIALREALKSRDDLRIILMSATMEENRELFQRYFADCNVCCIDIPAMLHKVEKFFLPEVLALTGYKTSDSNYFGATIRSLNDENYSSFPFVDEFHCDADPKSFRRNGGMRRIGAGQEKISNDAKSCCEVIPPRRPAQYAELTHSSSAPYMQPFYMATRSSHYEHKRSYPSTSNTGFQSYDDMSQDYRGSVFPQDEFDNYGEPYGRVSNPNEESWRCCEVYSNNQPFLPSAPLYFPQDYSKPPPNYDPMYVHSPYNMQAGLAPLMTLDRRFQDYHIRNYNSLQRYQLPHAFDNADLGNLPEWTTSSHYPTPTPFAQPHNQVTAHSDQQLNNNRKMYVTDLPNRPTYFNPSYIKTLRHTKLDTLHLVDSYLMSGGGQWAEGVDTDLTISVIKYCMDSPVDGSILVFLPGYEDIQTVREKAMMMEGCIRRPMIFILHSQMSSQDQQRVFEPVVRGCRKVILSTNIAEASLTIDDVVFVIDCGKVKEKNYDHASRISELKMTWIARSNAEQRAGRAGRCRNGYCFRLFTRDEYSSMNATQVAEMKRIAIHEVCLHAKMFPLNKTSVTNFLQHAPEPPHIDAIKKSMDFLVQIGALFDRDYDTLFNMDGRESELTDLGRHIAQLPLDPQLARLLLFGRCLRCFSPVLTLVAILSHRDPFVLPSSGDREERSAAINARYRFGGDNYSDHLALLRVYNEFKMIQPYKQSQFCSRNYLSLNTLRMIDGIRNQLFTELMRLHLLPMNCDSPEDDDLNWYSKSWPMIQAAIVAGCYPSIGFCPTESFAKKIRADNEVATLSFGCIVKRQTSIQYLSSSVDRPPNVEYFAFQELSKTVDGLNLRTVTAVSPITVFLFAGPIRLSRQILDDNRVGDLIQDGFGMDDEQNPTADEYVTVLDPWWLAFRSEFANIHLLLKLRVHVMSYFLSVMKNPGQSDTNDMKELLETLDAVLTSDSNNSWFPAVTDLPGPTDRPPNSYPSREEDSDSRKRHQDCQRFTAAKEQKVRADSLDDYGGCSDQGKLNRTRHWRSVSDGVDICSEQRTQLPSVFIRRNRGRRMSDNAPTRKDASENDLIESVVAPPSTPHAQDEEQIPEDPCTTAFDKQNEEIVEKVGNEENDRNARMMRQNPEFLERRNNRNRGSNWKRYGGGLVFTRRYKSQHFSLQNADTSNVTYSGQQEGQQNENLARRRFDRSNNDTAPLPNRGFAFERWRPGINNRMALETNAPKPAFRGPKYFVRGGRRGGERTRNRTRERQPPAQTETINPSAVSQA